MNLLLLEPSELDAEGRARLTGRRAEHLLKVLEVAPGRELRAGVVGGGTGTARVTAVAEGEVELRLEVRGGAARRPPLDLVLALPRPAVLHRVLQHAAAFGAGRLDLVNAWRVEKAFFSSPALEEGAVGRHLLLGAEQGRTTWLPEVRIHRLLVRFFEELREAPGPAPFRVLAHPRGEPIETVFPDSAPRRLQLAVGPEGGWIDREVASFEELGFRPARLGPWTLRVEAALAAAVGQIELLRRLRTEPPVVG